MILVSPRQRGGIEEIPPHELPELIERIKERIQQNSIVTQLSLLPSFSDFALTTNQRIWKKIKSDLTEDNLFTSFYEFCETFWQIMQNSSIRQDKVRLLLEKIQGFSNDPLLSTITVFGIKKFHVLRLFSKDSLANLIRQVASPDVSRGNLQDSITFSAPVPFELKGNLEEELARQVDHLIETMVLTRQIFFMQECLKKIGAGDFFSTYQNLLQGARETRNQFEENFASPVVPNRPCEKSSRDSCSFAFNFNLVTLVTQFFPGGQENTAMQHTNINAPSEGEQRQKRSKTITHVTEILEGIYKLESSQEMRKKATSSNQIFWNTIVSKTEGVEWYGEFSQICKNFLDLHKRCEDLESVMVRKEAIGLQVGILKDKKKLDLLSQKVGETLIEEIALLQIRFFGQHFLEMEADLDRFLENIHYYNHSPREFVTILTCFSDFASMRRIDAFDRYLASENQALTAIDTETKPREEIFFLKALSKTYMTFFMQAALSHFQNQMKYYRSKKINSFLADLNTYTRQLSAVLDRKK